MSTASDLRVVLISIDSIEAGRELATFLVEAKLAACVNLIPHIESIYRWQGTIHHDPEILLIAKTTAEAFPQLEAAVKAKHTYSTPEILALPAASVSQAYGAWVFQEVTTQLN
ncbi:MAG: divalent-cation tolerance protein CutA [Blastocatellia bacterium]|nr:divalent-cation tolerance protein CutA [Blastocatellia bacterium]